MQKLLKTLEYVFALLLLVFTEDAAWSKPVEASNDGYKVYLPAIYRPGRTFLPVMFSDYYSGILPPKYATGIQTGPEGGTVTALAVTSAGVIYAGSWGSGVYKSVDHGSTWTFANQGLVNGFIYSLAVDPTNPNVLYAGTYHSGVYKSTDGGASWNPTGPGLNPSAVVYALAVNPQNSNIIFAGTRGDSGSNTPDCPGPDIQYWGGGVFRSTDGGSTWKNVDGGQSCGYVYGLAIDSSRPNLVYVATHQKGVLRSIDGGSTFQYQNSALVDQATRSIVIDPINHNHLYLATWHGGAVYIGANDPDNNGADGITWNAANGGTAGIAGLHVIKVAVDPTVVYNYCALLYALIWDGGTGLAASSDCGSTWTRLGQGTVARYSYDLAIDPTVPTNLYLGMTGYGVYKSTNRGTNWASADHGLYNTRVNTLVSDPAAPSTFYVGTSNGGGIFKSLDGGATWVAINGGLPVSTNLYPSILKIAVDPLTPGTLYAGTDGSGIYKSIDSGSSWTPIDSGLPASVSQAGLNGPSSPFLPHPVPYDAPFFEAASPASTQAPVAPLLKSGSIPALVVDPLTPGIIYAGSWAGVLKSENGWTSWTGIGLTGQPIFSLAIDPFTPEILYAGTTTGVYKTVDGGETWDAVGLAADLVYDLAIDATDTSILYAATGGEGVFKSYDGGATWLDLNDGLADLQVYSLAIDPVHPEFQYAGTASGLYRTTKGGALWEPVNVGLYNTNVDPVMVNPATPGTIYLGTNNGTMIVNFSDIPPG